MKKSTTIIIWLLLIGIVSIPVTFTATKILIGFHQDNKIEKQQVKDIKPIVKEYLEMKYNEKIIMMEGGGKGKDGGMYFLSAFPENDPELQFHVRYADWVNIFQDDYLSNYAERKAKEYIIEAIGDVIEEDFDLFVRVDSSLEGLEKLENYYKENQKFMDWCEVEKRVESMSLRIYTKRLINSTKLDTTPIIEAIETLDFTIDEVYFDISMSKGFFYNKSLEYYYTDGAYVLDEE